MSGGDGDGRAADVEGWGGRSNGELLCLCCVQESREEGRDHNLVDQLWNK